MPSVTMKKLSEVQIREHELASLDAISDELCHRAAFRIAHRTADRAQVGNVTRRYDLIAKAFYCLRPKLLSKKQVEYAEQIFAEYACGANDAEMKEEELNLVKRLKTELTPEERATVDRERCKLWERIETRRDALLEKFIGARLATGNWPTTTADRLLRRMKRDGQAKLRRCLERVIRRYLFAKERGESWVTSLGCFICWRWNGCVMKRRSGNS
jgi:hypothetical protein